MRISLEHGRLERRIKRHWRRRLKSDPATKRKSRLVRDRYGTFKAILSPLFYRALCWCAALVPFPQGWMLATYLAAWTTAYHAAALDARGAAEAIIGLYGADDASIRNLSRRWMWSVASWALVDATVFLGIWWLTSKIPLWALALGLPCYVLGAVIGPRLLSFLVPERILNIFVFSGSFLAIALILTRDHLSAQTIDAANWLLGALSPSGWVILMLRELLEGRLLLWGVVPLLIAAAVLTVSIIRSQESGLWERLFGRDDSDEIQDDEPAHDGLATDANEAREEHGVTKELAAFRKRAEFDYPMEIPPNPAAAKWAAWHTGFILAAAVMVRLAIFPGPFPYLTLGGALVGAYFFWLPFLSKPLWLGYVALSTNQIASAFVLFPVSFRRLMITQMQRDLQKAARTMPPLFVIVTAALFIALPPDLPVVQIGLSMTIVFSLLLPLRWFHLATGPLSNRPFGIGNIWRGMIIFLMAILLVAEVGAAAGIFAAFSSGVSATIVIFVFIALGISNAALGLLGVYAALSAYEKKTVDVIKPPPQR